MIQRLTRLPGPTTWLLLSAKSLSADAVEARKLRDGAYTLVINTERRLRAAADYWYAGTDKLKDYAVFPASAASGGDDSEDDEEPAPDGTAAPAAGAAAEPAPAPAAAPDKPK